MLQNATKAITQAFSGSFIKKLSQYLHDCVREEVKSSTFRNLKGDKDNKWKFIEGDESVFSNFDTPLMLDGSDPLLTELMIQSEMSQKEKYLIYGYLFLVGKNSKTKRNNEYLTPLLYAPCRLQREGTKIVCSLNEEMLSLNTGAIAQLIKKEDEEEVDQMLSGLLEVVPELPLTNESLEIFLTTLKSLLPEVEIQLNPTSTSNYDVKNMDGFYQEKSIEDIENFDFDSLEEISKSQSVKLDKLYLENTQAVILTKRPTVTAGVLHELTQISEKSTGTIRENVLNVINQEYLRSKGKGEQRIKEEKEDKDFWALTPLSLSDSQESVIKKIEENDLLAVYGPPGTGKSQTIVNLVAHLIAKGKTVLVASRMDKAIDVVAERLNSLDAPYLALRAGRANYQKQLMYDLQDLLSNKVDLDTGFEDAVLVDTSDMEKLLGELKRLEENVEKIIKSEELWTELEEEKKELSEAIGELQYISRSLKLDEIDLIRKILDEVNKHKEKNKFFNKVLYTLNVGKIKKILDLKKIDEEEIITRLPSELDLEEYRAKITKVENHIFKIGNLQQILKRIATLKKKQKSLAIDILKNKRRTALKELLADQAKRQRLIVHARSLVSKKQQLQNRILEKEDFKPLLTAFPCWCTTTYAISNSIPLKSGMFDVVIIDEASQCDIASCFPILYRAKKAVIVGDDKQLPHLSFLEKAKEQSFLNQYGIDDKYQLTWRFRTNSMFDLANYYTTSPVLLDEHFRSEKPIIEFSSQEFYGGRIKIMKPYFPQEPAIELVYVPDAKVDYDITRNMVECEAVIKKLGEIISNDDPKKPTTIGVISPFRGQVELIKKGIGQVFSDTTITKHQIEVGTAHTFQGDEKDIILISWTVAPNSHSQSMTFMQKPNLFNVAITRARKKLYNFTSKQPQDLPEGLLRSYFEYIRETIKKDFRFTEDAPEFKNYFEEEVYNSIKDMFDTQNINEKIHVNTTIGGVSADILIGDLIIELDGVKDRVKSYVKPTKKQAILERSGYRIIRFTQREWHLNSAVCLEKIKSLI